MFRQFKNRLGPFPNFTHSDTPLSNLRGMVTNSTVTTNISIAILGEMIELSLRPPLSQLVSLCRRSQRFRQQQAAIRGALSCHFSFLIKSAAGDETRLIAAGEQAILLCSLPTILLNANLAGRIGDVRGIACEAQSQEFLADRMLLVEPTHQLQRQN
jgi:hypothetical protein